jgi:hypothetical protein
MFQAKVDQRQTILANEVMEVAISYFETSLQKA